LLGLLFSGRLSLFRTHTGVAATYIGSFLVAIFDDLPMLCRPIDVIHVDTDTGYFWMQGADFNRGFQTEGARGGCIPGYDSSGAQTRPCQLAKRL
jgi:hypothetical protein